MVGARVRNLRRIFDVSNAYKKKKCFFFSDALWGVGGTHRSWPGGQGGKLRALVAGEGWGGRRRGVQGLRCGGGVGGRGTGPRDGANFATCVVFLTLLTRTKRRKMFFFEGYPVGWGCVQGLGRGGPGAVVPGG